MAIQIKHAFISLKGNGTDATLVQPSNWNAAHSTSIASGNLVGRLSAGAGSFEEIPISAYMASLLAATDANALAGLLGIFETGDIKYTFKNAASDGWLLLPGGTALSIGNTGSGATLRANADTQALYTVIWNSVSNANAPVSGGRGASAAADFSAGKTLTIPNLVGRSPMGAGAATAGLTARTIGAIYGEELHTLSAAEIPLITSSGPALSVSVNSPGNVITGNITNLFLASGGGSVIGLSGGSGPTVVTSTGFTAGQSVNSNNTGGAGHNTLHPVTALNVMVKL